jgi:sugar lactone lactonase YvrE
MEWIATDEQIADKMKTLPKIGEWVEISPDGTKAQCVGYRLIGSADAVCIDPERGTFYHSGFGREVLLRKEQVDHITPMYDY